MLIAGVDISGLEQHEQAFLAQLDRLWLEFAKLTAETVRRFIVEQMINSPVPPGEFSADRRLHILSGEYARSFSPGQPFNLYRVDLTSGTITVGSNAPQTVHEEGARIAATPKMVRFFWAKFLETQLPKWKIMALAARSRGAIILKARPHVDPAEVQFVRQGLDSLALELTVQIMGAWERT